MLRYVRPDLRLYVFVIYNSACPFHNYFLEYRSDYFIRNQFFLEFFQWLMQKVITLDNS